MTEGVAFTVEELDAFKKGILEYFVKTPGGTFAAACKSVGLAYSTAYRIRKCDKQFDADVIAARKAADDLGGDFAESKLMEAINNNELTGIIFYLKTKHKHRGYIERVQNESQVEITAKTPAVSRLAEIAAQVDVPDA